MRRSQQQLQRPQARASQPSTPACQNSCRGARAPGKRTARARSPRPCTPQRRSTRSSREQSRTCGRSFKQWGSPSQGQEFSPHAHPRSAHLQAQRAAGRQAQWASSAAAACSSAAGAKVAEKSVVPLILPLDDSSPLTARSTRGPPRPPRRPPPPIALARIGGRRLCWASRWPRRWESAPPAGCARARGKEQGVWREVGVSKHGPREAAPVRRVHRSGVAWGR